VSKSSLAAYKIAVSLAEYKKKQKKKNRTSNWVDKYKQTKKSKTIAITVRRPEIHFSFGYHASTYYTTL